MEYEKYNKALNIAEKEDADSQIQRINYWLPVGRGDGGGREVRDADY